MPDLWKGPFRRWAGRRRRLSSFHLSRRGERRQGVLKLLLLFLTATALLSWLVRPLNAVPEPTSPIIKVYRHDLGTTVSMDLEDYVKGVIAAEMPVSFHLEALKAQAVAARTLALRLIRENQPLPGLPGQSDAIISTDPATHQAWVSEEELQQRWGLLHFVHWGKITRAVAATRGMVVVYHGELIFPAYHSSSGGQTEDSEKYWTGYLPYLRSVPDPYVAGSRYEETQAVFQKSELAAATGQAVPASAGTPLVEVLARFPSGRVQTVRVGDQRMTGRELRERIGLRSNWFEVEERGDQVHFTVKGYGHGVGMSQYGADGMGRAGFTFDQILRHYYTGVDVVSWYK